MVSTPRASVPAETRFSLKSMGLGAARRAPRSTPGIVARPRDTRSAIRISPPVKVSAQAPAPDGPCQPLRLRMHPVGSGWLRLQQHRMLLEHLESLGHAPLELWIAAGVQIVGRLLHQDVRCHPEVLDIPLPVNNVKPDRGRRNET